jgi:hypothetical protein
MSCTEQRNQEEHSKSDQQGQVEQWLRLMRVEPYRKSTGTLNEQEE